MNRTCVLSLSYRIVCILERRVESCSYHCLDVAEAPHAMTVFWPETRIVGGMAKSVENLEHHRTCK